MSRSIKGKKGPGCEWWSRRRFSNFGGCTPSREMKRLTNRIERRKARNAAYADEPLYPPTPKVGSRIPATLFIGGREYAVVPYVLGDERLNELSANFDARSWNEMSE